MKTEQQVLQENINELVRLQAENPDARVICFVNEECNNGEYGYMSSNFGMPRLEKMAVIDNVYTDDEDDVYQSILDDIDNEDHDDLQYREIEEIADDRYEKIEWESIIVIYIDPA